VLWTGADRKMTQIPLALEKVWLGKARYEKAERIYYENLARVSRYHFKKKSPTSLYTNSILLRSRFITRYPEKFNPVDTLQY
jgi:hypothetical protein